MKRKDMIEKKLSRATDITKPGKALHSLSSELYDYALEEGTRIQKEYVKYIRNICNYLLDNSGYDKDFNIDPGLENVVDDIENMIFGDIKKIQHTVDYAALGALLENWGD